MTDLPASQENRQPLIAVYETNNYSEAHLIVAKLASENIPAIVQRESAGAAIGISVGHFGSHYVLVHTANRDHALSILFPAPPTQLPDSTADVSYYISEDDDFDEYSD